MKSITEYSTNDLKALGFDQIQMLEQAKTNLVAINQELARRAKEVSETPEHITVERPASKQSVN